MDLEILKLTLESLTQIILPSCRCFCELRNKEDIDWLEKLVAQVYEEALA